MNPAPGMTISKVAHLKTRFYACRKMLVIRFREEPSKLGMNIFFMNSHERKMNEVQGACLGNIIHLGR